MTGSPPEIKTSASQLVVNGGRGPAFSKLLHVGRPNVADRAMFLELLGEALDRNWLTNAGPLVRRFEQVVAEYVGVGHCVAMANGTVALQCLMRALDLEGDVLVPAHTFIATAHAAEWVGLRPVFADVDPETHNLSPRSVRGLLTEDVAAIVPVHLWGRAADVDVFADIERESGIPVIYDAAHALGASAGSRMVGGFGRAEVMSFHATKFINSIEGGAVVTDDADLAEELRRLRNFGFAGLDLIVSHGTNAKMTEASAAMGIANFAHIEAIIEQNRSNHRRYVEAARDVPGMRILEHDPDESSNYQYVVAVLSEERARERDEIVRALHAENVLARRYFWPAAHRTEPYRSSAAADLPVTEDLASRVIVLPTGLTVGDVEIDAVMALLRALS